MAAVFLGCGDKEPGVDDTPVLDDVSACEAYTGYAGYCECKHPNSVSGATGYFLVGFDGLVTRVLAEAEDAITGGIVHTSGGKVTAGSPESSGEVDLPGSSCPWDLIGGTAAISGEDIACSNHNCDGMYSSFVQTAGACASYGITEITLSSRRP